MRRSPVEKLRGAAAWIGGDGVELPHRTLVVSPHLDDAVLSLGASISYASRHGRPVTVLTVLAGNPDSSTPAGAWDSASGFATAGAAAAGRREEDRRASGLVGATAIWLPFSDNQYERGGGEDAVVSAVTSVIADAGAELALIPGFPLEHPDHAWLAAALGRASLPVPVGGYVEQPYAALEHERLPPGSWHRARATLRDRFTKLRAIGAYETQLAQLGPHLRRRIARYERSRGGETATW